MLRPVIHYTGFLRVSYSKNAFEGLGVSGRRKDGAQDQGNYPVLGPSRGLIPPHFNVRQRVGMISQETHMNGDSKEGQERDRQRERLLGREEHIN